nr:MAG TPA: transcription initiation factor TFIID [Caudoviricetes sp.]
MILLSLCQGLFSYLHLIKYLHKIIPSMMHCIISVTVGTHLFIVSNFLNLSS